MTMSVELDSTLKSSTKEENILFIQLKNLFRKAGVEVPNMSRKLFKLLMEPNHERLELLAHMCHKLHPDESFWKEEPEESQSRTRQPKKSPDEAILTKCWNVNQWFGLTRDEGVIRGTAEPSEQYDFWLNLIQVIVERMNSGEYLEPTLHNPKILERIVSSSTIGMDEIREANFVAGSNDAIKVFKSGGEYVKTLIDKVDKGINSIKLEIPEKQIPIIEISNQYALQQLQVYLETEVDNNFNITQETHIQAGTADSNLSNRNISDFRNELDEAIGNIELVMKNARTKNE